MFRTDERTVRYKTNILLFALCSECQKEAARVLFVIYIFIYVCLRVCMHMDSTMDGKWRTEVNAMAMCNLNAQQHQLQPPRCPYSNAIACSSGSASRCHSIALQCAAPPGGATWALHYGSAPVMKLWKAWQKGSESAEGQAISFFMREYPCRNWVP